MESNIIDNAMQALESATIDAKNEIAEKLKNEITIKSGELKQVAVDLVITDQATNDQAGRLRNDLKPWYQKIADYCDPIVKEFHRQHKEACDLKKKLAAPLDEADKILFNKQKKFLQQQHEKEQERIRKEREAADKANREAQERALDKAVKEGKIEKAESILNHTSPPQIFATQKVKSETSVTVDRWTVKIFNPADVPREWCCPDLERLTELANKNKGQNAPAGVEFVYDPVIKRK
jgi:hypothetical protein